MNFRKSFLKILVFFLILSTLSVSLLKLPKVRLVEAQTSDMVLRFCIRSDIYIDTSPYISPNFDPNKVITQADIDANPVLGKATWITLSVSTEQLQTEAGRDAVCPGGYVLAPADFDLETYEIDNNVPIIGQNPSTTIDQTPGSQGGTGGINPGGTTGSSTNSTPSGPGGHYQYDPTTGKYIYVPSTSNADMPTDTNLNDYGPYPTGNKGDYLYNNNTNSYVYKSTDGSGNNNGNGTGNGNGDGSIFDVNPNPVIQINPSLAHGRFESLDPRDYKYCVLLTHDMLQGMTDATTNDEVTALQKYLYDRGYMDVPDTGYFGSNTTIAVEKFQYRNQIEVSGIVKADFRETLKELTCIRYPIISYVDKPISPTPAGAKSPIYTSHKTTTPTTIPVDNSDSSETEDSSEDATDTEVVVIPTTTVDNADTDNFNKLSTVFGNMYLSQGNNLYFTFNSQAVAPYICIDLDNIDCTDPNNYDQVYEGIKNNLYEVVNFSAFWAFYLYNADNWGKAGDKVKIYLKDSQHASDYYVYVVNIFN